MRITIPGPPLVVIEIQEDPCPSTDAGSDSGSPTSGTCPPPRKGGDGPASPGPAASIAERTGETHSDGWWDGYYTGKADGIQYRPRLTPVARAVIEEACRWKERHANDPVMTASDGELWNAVRAYLASLSSLSSPTPNRERTST